MSSHFAKVNQEPDRKEDTEPQRSRRLVLLDRSAADIAADPRQVAEIAALERELQIPDFKVGLPVSGFLRVHTEVELRDLLTKFGNDFDIIRAYSRQGELIGVCAYFSRLDGLDHFNQAWLNYLRDNLNRFPELSREFEEGRVGIVDMGGVIKRARALTGWSRSGVSRMLQHYCIQEMLGEHIDTLLAVVRCGQAGNPALKSFIEKGHWTKLGLDPFPDSDPKYRDLGISWEIIAIDVRDQKGVNRELIHRRKSGEVVAIDLDGKRRRLERVPEAVDLERETINLWRRTAEPGL